MSAIMILSMTAIMIHLYDCYGDPILTFMMMPLNDRYDDPLNDCYDNTQTECDPLNHSYNDTPY